MSGKRYVFAQVCFYVNVL